VSHPILVKNQLIQHLAAAGFFIASKLSNGLIASSSHVLCSRCQSRLLNKKEPLRPAPLSSPGKMETYTLACLGLKRPKSTKFYRILQNQSLQRLTGA
jgi:hypothetical protein